MALDLNKLTGGGTWRDAVKAIAYILVGTFVLSLGFVLFINPYKIVPGGVYGISIVIHHSTKGLFDLFPDGTPIGLVSACLDTILTIIGTKILGPRFGFKTVLGFISTAVFMDTLTAFIGEDDPLGLADDLLLASVFGATIIGIGLASVFKSKATSGGSDIIAAVIAKYTHLPIGHLLIYVDSAIALLGLIAFSDWKIPLYSWLVIFITGKVVDMILEGAGHEKMLLIISDRHEEIRERLLNDLGRGGTYLNGEGMYGGTPKKVIYTIVDRREVLILEEHIGRIDPNAFVAVIDAKEILGEGFKSLSEKTKG